MTVIKNAYFPFQQLIKLEMNLVKNESYLYNKDEKWIPIDIKLFVEEEIYGFEHIPTLNIFGTNLLIQNMEDIIEEKKRDKGIEEDKHYSSKDYFATEADFRISFCNIPDVFDEDRVNVKIWFHNFFGYNRGFEFQITMNDLELLAKEMKRQFFELTNGDEGSISCT